MVDYVLASQLLLDQFLFFNVPPFKATLSDCHCKLSWNMLSNFTIERHTKVDTYPMPTKYIWDENSSSLFQRSLAEPEIKNKIHVFVNSEVADINLAARALNDIYLQAADISIKRGKPPVKKGVRKRKKWFDTDLRKLRQRLMSYGKVYCYYPNDPVVRGHYFKWHKEYARSRKLKSRQFKAKILDQIDNLHTNDPKAYWKKKYK